ncbi:bifunctional 2-polyprenyl-6-hydroxyphenol methylase/3-demethylubiquinol 3-O-methyltransferase UbiG [Acidisoma sp. S159]|uniref:class I SAM-dependent methyltransferase n=1 Tax=Acidisoma sp. S159 TaxID=1747225 RepID=UPI00131DFFB9|nr:class I SAM-dependent methyltransferase [Acidisoma sp. S159]
MNNSVDPDFWPEFYDPDLYEQNIGPGGRIAEEYRQLLVSSSGERLAEIGCGPGGVLIALAKEGFCVTGVDRSRTMLERARVRISHQEAHISEKIELISGSLENFALRTKVDAVLLTNELILHVLESELLITSLQNCYGNLRERGCIILDLPEINFANLADSTGSGGERVYCRGFYPTNAGTVIRVTEQVQFNPHLWIKDMTFAYEFIARSGKVGEVLFRRLRQRLWTPQEVKFALQIAGFGSIEEIKILTHPDRTFIRARREDT